MGEGLSSPAPYSAPRHWHPPTSPHFLHHFHGHSIPGTLAHFQSLTPTWIQQWPPLEGCTASPPPRQPLPGILAASPPAPYPHTHTCVPFPRGPGVLARNSTPVPSTQRLSLSPFLLSAWLCLDLTHPLVACPLSGSPKGFTEAWGTGSHRSQKPQAPRAGLGVPLGCQHLRSGLLGGLLSCTQTCRGLGDAEVVA